MRVWKVFSLYCSDEELESWLNQFEAEGKRIKEVLCIDKFDYKIIYTVEDIEEDDHGHILH
jgi:hypothetical protein